jgi:sterol 3beta-glucosyltransferase
MHVVPRPPDWKPWHSETGYWFAPPADDWSPPPELEAFLAAGPPPVSVGFGSMSGRDPARAARVVLEAVRLAGVRAVLVTGWGGLAAADLPPGVFTIDQAPYDWLFPRVAAVVHHGGAGTTAAGLRAGRPSILCPFIVDQFFWGRRVHELGAGPRPIPQKRLTSEALAGALREATTSAPIQAAAADLGRRLAAEDGVARAVALIERIACN